MKPLPRHLPADFKDNLNTITQKADIFINLVNYPVVGKINSANDFIFTELVCVPWHEENKEKPDVQIKRSQ